MRLVYETTGYEVKIGDTGETRNGEAFEITGITQPHNEHGHGGRVHTTIGSFYASVVGAKWQADDAPVQAEPRGVVNYGHGLQYVGRESYAEAAARATPAAANTAPPNQAPLQLLSFRPQMLDVIYIDAWADVLGGWSWNSWHKVGEISRDEFQAACDAKHSNRSRKLLAIMRRVSNLGHEGAATIEDDGYNVVAVARHSGMPLYAIVYGPAY